jgi:hypothetical protein
VRHSATVLRPDGRTDYQTTTNNSQTWECLIELTAEIEGERIY